MPQSVTCIRSSKPIVVRDEHLYAVIQGDAIRIAKSVLGGSILGHSAAITECELVGVTLECFSAHLQDCVLRDTRNHVTVDPRVTTQGHKVTAADFECIRLSTECKIKAHQVNIEKSVIRAEVQAEHLKGFHTEFQGVLDVKLANIACCTLEGFLRTQDGTIRSCVLAPMFKVKSWDSNGVVKFMECVGDLISEHQGEVKVQKCNLDLLEIGTSVKIKDSVIRQVKRSYDQPISVSLTRCVIDWMGWDGGDWRDMLWTSSTVNGITPHTFSKSVIKSCMVGFRSNRGQYLEVEIGDSVLLEPTHGDWQDCTFQDVQGRFVNAKFTNCTFQLRAPTLVFENCTFEGCRFNGEYRAFGAPVDNPIWVETGNDRG